MTFLFIPQVSNKADDPAAMLANKIQTPVISQKQGQFT